MGKAATTGSGTSEQVVLGRDHVGARLDGLRLRRRLGERTWLGTTASDDPVAVTRLGATSTDGEDLATTLVAVRSAQLVPVRRVIHEDGSMWLVSDWDGGISLRRLLRLAQLTPGQAVYIAGQIALAGQRLRGVESPRSMGSGDVRIGPDGEVRLANWACGEGDADGGSLIAMLMQSTRGSPSDPDGDTELLGRLRQAAELAESPELSESFELSDPAEPDRGALVDLLTLDPRVEQATRAELAALVNAVARPVTPAGQPTTARRAAPPNGSGRARRALRGGGRWLIAWVAALGVLVLAVVLELTFLHGRLSNDVHQIFGDRPHSHPSSPTPHVAAGVTPRQVSAPAPAARGMITSVGLRPLKPCRPGAACSVRVLVQLQAHARPIVVRWHFRSVGRCVGGAQVLPGGAAAVAAGDNSAIAVSVITLPPGRALAVFAVTSAPARAASQAALVPAQGARC